MRRGVVFAQELRGVHAEMIRNEDGLLTFRVVGMGPPNVELTLDLTPFLFTRVEITEFSHVTRNANDEICVKHTSGYGVDIHITGEIKVQEDGTIHSMKVVESRYGDGFNDCGEAVK